MSENNVKYPVVVGIVRDGSDTFRYILTDRSNLKVEEKVESTDGLGVKSEFWRHVTTYRADTGTGKHAVNMARAVVDAAAEDPS